MVAIDPSRTFDPFCHKCGRIFYDTSEYRAVNILGVGGWVCRRAVDHLTPVPLRYDNPLCWYWQEWERFIQQRDVTPVGVISHGVELY